jgi:hypothetical protein
LRDAEILARADQDPELAGLAEHAVGLHSELDLGDQIEILLDRQEGALGEAIRAAFDLD